MTTLTGTVRDNLGRPLTGVVRFTATGVHKAAPDVFLPRPVDVPVSDGVPDPTAEVVETTDVFRYRIEFISGPGLSVEHRVMAAIVAGPAMAVADLVESGTVIPLSVADGLQAQLDALAAALVDPARFQRVAADTDGTPYFEAGGIP